MIVEAAVTAFKRASSVENSTWYKGILISHLTTAQDAGGAFDFVEGKMKRAQSRRRIFTTVNMRYSMFWTA